MKSKSWTRLIPLLVLASMLLAACQPAAVETVTVTQIVEVPGATQIVERTVEVPVPVEPEATPTPEAVDRMGAWLDTIVVVEEPSTEAAVSRMNVGELDVYAFAVSDPEIYQSLNGMENLTYASAIGANNEISFNPSGPEFEGTGMLNPFSVRAIREAMNWLVDREYIGQEIMGGLGVPRYLPIVSGFPDYARYIDTARELEAKYRYNPDRAQEVITQEMEALGAELVEGRWTYNGEPVEIIGLIRTEDERREIGDYVANQLESLGFAVRRDYKSSAEASPIWLSGNPADGEWHYYTGGWITTSVSRDQGGNFDFYFTPRGRTSPLWQAYSPSPEFDAVSDRLFRNDFSSLEERDELFRQALAYALEDSQRIWVVDELSFSPLLNDVEVAADLAGGVQGAWLWPFTLRRAGEVGGSMTLANASILTDPWNPIAGSNWVYDAMLERGTGDRETMPDPFTGLAWPQRIDRAEVFIQEGLPVTRTLDWVDLQFVPTNEVPADAWIDWDAETQQFITVGEKHPEGLSSVAKVVAYYPEDFYDIKWHDGSTMSLADIVMAWILTFDTGKEASPIYDEAQAPALASTQTLFRGLRIVQENPLVIEFYSDQYFLDAESNVDYTFLPFPVFFPYYPQGPGAWHNLGLGVLAESNQELAFSASKADALEVEWMSYIGGPSLEILNNYLQQAQTEAYIPYAPTLSQYITAEDAAARWANLAEWYRRHNHFWVGTGAFYVDKVFPVEGTVIMQRNPDYPDSADKWARFGEPQFATVEIDGPGRVTNGEEASYDVFVTNPAGEDYAMADVSLVKYLVFGATGELAFTGEAEAVEDGLWNITLTADQTASLEAGSNTLEVAVVSNLISSPGLGRFEFVTAP
jgi:peptide/nickel transport system substrate-binding protein